jgi:hypothetical protein
LKFVDRRHGAAVPGAARVFSSANVSRYRPLKRWVAGLAAATYLAGLLSVPAGDVVADSSFTDLPGWNLVFADEFDTAIARGSFAAATAGRYFVFPNSWKDTSRNGTYSPEIIAVQNGILDIAIGTVNGVHKVAGFSPLPAGRLSSQGDLLGMRIAFRIRADRMVGYKGVPLLWPMSNNWPWDGEIDFPESSFDGKPMAFMHHQNATLGSDQDWYATPTGTSWQDWHDYVIEWVPGVRADFIIDGVSIGHSINRVPTSAMHLNMQFETQLSGGAPADSVSGNIQIDRLAVWAVGTGSAAVAPSPTPVIAPTPAATPTPAAAPTPIATPTPTPRATPTPTPTPTPGATPTASPSPTPTTKETSTTQAIVRYGDSSQQITYSSGWSIAKYGGYLGGAVHYSGTQDATATFRFTGSAVSWLGPTGPTRGKANVYVDGAFVRTVDLYASRFHARPAAIFTQTWAQIGTHSLTIKVAGTLDRPIVAIDGFTVRR